MDSWTSLALTAPGIIPVVLENCIAASWRTALPTTGIDEVHVKLILSSATLSFYKLS